MSPKNSSQQALPPVNFQPIGLLESCFREKFGVPRQPGLVPEAKAVLRLTTSKDSIRSLEGFSHVWILFVFHQVNGWNPLVRPPRLGGAKKVGVFASRSPHRPNPIGLSLVKLDRVVVTGNKVELHLSGGDFVDGTPVLDVKPYIHYADSVRGAKVGWADGKLTKMKVTFDTQCKDASLRRLIRQMLALDPRPSHQTKTSAVASYAARVRDCDVHWEVHGRTCRVTRIVREPSA